MYFAKITQGQNDKNAIDISKTSEIRWCIFSHFFQKCIKKNSEPIHLNHKTYGLQNESKCIVTSKKDKF